MVKDNSLNEGTKRTSRKKKTLTDVKEIEQGNNIKV
jgi:hypothetical protein